MPNRVGLADMRNVLVRQTHAVVIDNILEGGPPA